MTLEHSAKDANEAVAQMCTDFMENSSGPKDYECLVGSAASTLLFHAFRTGLRKSEAHGVAVLQAVLADTARNLKRLGGHDVHFQIQWRESRKA